MRIISLGLVVIATSVALVAPARADDAVAPTDRRALPIVDGVYQPEVEDGVAGGGGGWNTAILPIYGVVGAMHAEALHAEATRGTVSLAAAAAARPRVCNKTTPTTFSWMYREAGRVRVAVAVTCGRVQVRDGTTPAATFQVMVYDDHDRLALTAGSAYVSGYTWASIDGSDTIVGARVVNTDFAVTLDRRLVPAK